MSVYCSVPCLWVTFSHTPSCLTLSLCFPVVVVLVVIVRVAIRYERFNKSCTIFVWFTYSEIKLRLVQVSLVLVTVCALNVSL